MTGPFRMRYAYINALDESILACDLKGDRPWIECGSQPEKYPDCDPRTAHDEALGAHLRVAQFSARFRGNPSGGNISSGGWVQYQDLTVHGNDDTYIELAPYIQKVSYLPYPQDGGSHRLVFSFSSSIQPSSGLVDARVVGGPARLSTLDIVETRDSSSITVELDREAVRPLSLLQWRQSDAELRRKYGGWDKSNWPYLLEVNLRKVRAPSGIFFRGNSLSEKKWIWPDGQAYRQLSERSALGCTSDLGPASSIDTPPFEIRNGFVGDDPIFTVWIPLEPSGICCLPVVETPTCREGGVEKTYCRQNGCRVDSSVLPADCSTNMLGKGDYNCGIFIGGFSPYSEPCDGTASTDCSPTAISPPGLPSVLQNCGATPQLKIHSQYKKWPLDQNEEQKCLPWSCPRVVPTPVQCWEIRGKAATPPPGPSPTSIPDADDVPPTPEPTPPPPEI